MKRFKLNWAIPGLLAMIAIIIAIAWIQTQAAASPDPAKLSSQCGSCHTMDTHVANWEQSSHKTVACTECHADPGAMGWLKMQYGLIQMKKADPNQIDLTRVATVVPNERCIDCHARQMPWVMQDLQAPKLDENGEPQRPATADLKHLSAVAGHDVHLTMENPLRCTECHSAVSHGPSQPAERVQNWHQVCLDCHATEKVAVEVRNTISCSACHLDMDKMTPPDHKTKEFRDTHGASAQKDITSCQECHLNPGIASKGGTPAHTFPTSALPAPKAVGGMKAEVLPQFPAGSLQLHEGATKDTCAQCHGTTMPHPAQWLTSHAKGFNEKPELCATCHGTQEQGMNLKYTGNPRTLSTTDKSCTGCHAQPMPHGADFLSNHDSAYNQNPVSCEQCHSPKNPANPTAAHASPKFCSDCHLGSFSHPAKYVATHKTVLAQYGNNLSAAGCTQCHTSTQNTCTSCHTDGLGKKQQWHSEWWWVTHSRTTTPENKAACMTCHDAVQPSCSKCHTSQ